MYGNFEYGSLIYGDAITFVTIFVSISDIEIVFMSKRKPYVFISGRKSNIFKAYEKISSRRR